MSIKNTKKLYYQVIPLIRLSLTKSNEFTYHYDKNVKFGSIVKIKLNNKTIRGIVVSKHTKQVPIFKTSPILDIITSGQITKQQLTLAKLISEYYLTPLSTTLKFFDFKLTKKNNVKYFAELKKQFTTINKKKWQKNIILTSQQKKAIDKINTSKKLNFLLFGPPASGKTEVIIETIKHTLQNNQQSLILIPEIFLSYQEIIRYSNKFIKEANAKIAILHSQLKPSEITTIWNAVKSEKVKIIISTRMGIFLPFANLGLIVIDEEQDISHKQWDTPPFYHTRQVVELIQKTYFFPKSPSTFFSKKEKMVAPKIILVSSTPSLNSYHKAKNNKNWQLLKLPMLQIKKLDLKNKPIKITPPQLELVDLKKYYKKGQQILISNELRFALKNSLAKNKIAMILAPRRGKSSTIICQDCHKAPTCPNCQVPLTHSGNYYRCLHCNFKISNISKCPHCGSFRLADIGFGTESIQDTIQTIFPSSKTIIANGTTFRNNSYRQKILNKLYNNQLDFLIGTYTIAKGLDIDAVNLVAILNADNWPGQTDFRFDENYLSTLFQLAGRVNRPGSTQNGKCLIQTFDPTNRIFTYLKNWNWKEFINYELDNRQALKYPPFSHLLKITFHHCNKKIVEKKLAKLHKKLTKYTFAIKPHYQILPPYFSHQKKLRGQWHKHLLLKVSALPITDKALLKILDLPIGWKIDVETENIF